MFESRRYSTGKTYFDQHHILYNLEANHMTFQDEKMNYEFVKHRLKDGENLNY